MKLIQCKVIKGKYGPQVVHEGEFYKIGSFSATRVTVGREYEFILEEKEHGGKTIRWANLPRKKTDEEDIDESVPPKTGNGLKRLPDEPKPRKQAAAKSPIEWKVIERIADALEGIESLLDIMVNRNEENY